MDATASLVQRPVDTLVAEDMEWRFRARAVLATFEAVRLPSWLGGQPVYWGRATVRARRAVARTYAAVCGDEETGERGLVEAAETDPRRRVEADPFVEETETAVRCGYDLQIAVAVDRESRAARWPSPGADRGRVREALADEIDEALAAAGEPGWPVSVTVTPVGT